MRLLLSALAAVTVGFELRADDWPTLGRDRTHNAVSLEKNAPTDWKVETRDDKTGVKMPAKNVAWAADLGSMSLGGPVVADGLVWVGTNNQQPRDPKYANPMKINPVTKKPEGIDASVLMCFRESDGKFLWQYVSPRLRNMNINVDWPYTAIGNAPLVEGDRIWFLTNRCEVVCFDIGPLKRGGEPKELWKVDMRKDFKVHPHVLGMAMGFTSSPAGDAERLFVVTGNGVDEDHVTIPSPDAPSLICFDKKTGKALWTDKSPGKDIMHTQRSTPLVVDVKGRTQVIVGQGDGWLRSFDAPSGKLIWKCDLNPVGATYTLGGKGERNEVLAAPVYHDGRVYICPGQDPEHYVGTGYVYCIDPTKEGDVSLELNDGKGKGKPNPNSAVVWRYGGRAPADNDKREFLFSRTIANVTIHDGLAYAVDIDGYAYCFDASTGKKHWDHDLRSSAWAAPLWVDGKVYVPTEDGDVFVFAHGKEKKLITKIESDRPIRSGLVFANGTLFIMAENKLYAIRKPK